ncbi:MAG: hypothetical protein EB127_01030 [Alphaproteobacteria bacterium]|nr:hypothetical protein [Alphaproteobacteria bacterium]
MVKKKKRTELTPYWFNPDISIFYELEFGKKTITQGSRLKVKGARGIFVFHKMVHNSKIDKTWIDCMDESSGEFRSFYVDKIKAILPAKRSRANSE